jgi:uncharacterized protein (TIGR02145 family)
MEYNTMKKLLLSLLLLVVTMPVYSAEPLVKFYLNDGTFKAYNLSEIDNLRFPNAPDTLQLQVFTKDSTYYYPAQLIDSIKFFVDEKNEDRIHLWHDGFKWDFGVHEIDSILIYYTKHVAVTIGTQHWMYRNLDVDHYRNGDSIPEVRDSAQWVDNYFKEEGQWCYLYNDTNIGKTYGKLYNWFVINDLRGIAPIGWHITSDEEWSKLENFLGGSYIAGGKLKSNGVLENLNGLWHGPDPGNTNESGFTGLPAGFYDFSRFKGLSRVTYWWTSTENEQDLLGNVWIRHVFDSNVYILRNSINKGVGFSIRCIKDK